MSYVIVKDNKKLYGFYSNNVPVSHKRVYYNDPLTCREDFRYEKIFSTKYMFTYYKDSYTRFKDYTKAKEHLECMKNDILENESLYEEFLQGSTQKLLDYIDTLEIIEDDKIFNN